MCWRSVVTGRTRITILTMKNWTNLSLSWTVVDGLLGLGAGVEEALIPTVIDGITNGKGGGEGKEGKE